MEDSRLKLFVKAQLANKLNKDIDSFDALIIDMMVQKNKEELIDYFNQEHELNAQVSKTVRDLERFKDKLNDFLESSYEDFKEHPLSMEALYSEKKVLEIEITSSNDAQTAVQTDDDNKADDETANDPNDAAVLDVLKGDKNIVTPSLSTINIPKKIEISTPIDSPLPVSNPSITPVKPAKDMRFGSSSAPKPPPQPIKKLYFMNGEEDKDYQYKLDWQKLGLLDVGKHRFVGIENFGL